MQLPGHLRLTTLGDLLGALYRERASGVLELIEPIRLGHHRVHRVYLDHGLVRDVETPLPAARLGEILRAEGSFGEHALRWVERSGAARAGRRLGEWLVEARVIGADVVQRALRVQRRARLEQLYSVSEARVAFRVPRRHAASDLPLSPGEVLGGRPRRRDLKGRSTRSRQDPARTGALRVLGLGDGANHTEVHRTFRRLAAGCHPDRFPHANESERSELMRRFSELSRAYHTLVA
jgi:hypothetical protein